MKSSKNYQTFDRKDVAYVLQHMEGLTESQALKITSLVFDSVVWAIILDKRVAIPNFGVLRGVKVESRVGFHPQKLTSFQVPASVRLKVRMAKSFKEQLRKRHYARAESEQGTPETGRTGD